MKKSFIIWACLLAGMAPVWGAWSGSGSAVSGSGTTWYVYDNSSEKYKTAGGAIAVYFDDFSLSGPGKQINFEAKRVTAGTGTLVLRQNNGSWSDIWSNSMSTSYQSYSASVNANATKLQFYIPSGSLNKYVKNIKVLMAQYIENPSSTAEMAWGAGKVDDANVTKSVTIAWCNVPAFTYSVSGTGSEQVSVSITNNASYGKYHTATVKVTYNRNVASTLDATLTISNTYNSYSKNIKLSGSTAKYDQVLTWNNEGTIELNMLLGSTQNISASSDMGQTVVYSSSNNAIMSVDANGKLTANALGSVVITASQPGDYKYNAATPLEKTFQVKTKDTPIFTPEGFSEGETNNLKVGEQVTLGVQYVSEGLTGNFTATGYDANVLGITREGNTITIEALNEGNTGVVFTQTETAAIFGASKTYSFAVAKIDNTLSVDSAHAMKVEELWSDVVTNQNSDGVITTESSDSTVAYYDVVSNQIVAQNTQNQSFDSKEVTITIHQAATYKYAAATRTIAVTVDKQENHIAINGQEDTYSQNVYMDGYANILLSATNTDYEGSPITHTQTEGTNIATFYQDQEVVYTTHILGDAVWTISQPENYKYKAATATMTIHVVKQAEATDCYVLNAPDEKSYGKYGDCENTYYQDFTLSGPGKTLSFKMWKYSGWNDIGMKIYGYDANDEEVFVKEYAIGELETSAKLYSFDISADVTRIRIQNGGGTWASCSSLNCYASEVKVTRYTYLRAADVAITQTEKATPIHINEIGVGQMAINYSIANGGKLKLSWDNAKFVIQSHVAGETIDLGDKTCSNGTIQIPLVYCSDVAGNDTAHVVIYNNVYRATATIIGTTLLYDQTISWYVDDTHTYPLGDSIELTATATSELEVSYRVDNENVAVIRNHENVPYLVFVAEGEVTVTAEQAGNDFYAAAEPVAYTLQIEATLPTALPVVNKTEGAYKFLYNGKIYIRRNGIYYDALGSKVR